MTFISILTLSILLQLSAAILALRLVAITGRRRAWVLIAAALVLMTFRRSITWFRLLTGDLTSPPDLTAELVALVISVLMVAGVAGIASQFHAIRRSEETLRESEARFRMVTEGALAGVYIIQDGKFPYVNPALAQILGYRPEELIDRLGPLDLVHPDDRDLVAGNIRRRLEGQAEGLQYTFRALRKDGQIVHCEVLGCRADYQGQPAILGTLLDITERVKAEEQLQLNAFHDALTGLPNRALFTDRLGRVMARSKRHNSYLYAVLFLDLDHFKNINEGLGHVVGDQLLIAIADRLRRVLRPGDTLSRLGSDEFAILLDTISDVSDASRVASRVQKQLALPFYLSGNEVYISASIGIALSTTGNEQPRDLLRDAETAMYRAKEKGPALYEIFDAAIHKRAVARLQLETELRRAVELQEFCIHYQPIVSLSNDMIAGFEALVRWQHPERGLVFPADFIPLAEETGLIIAIDQWVLREACRRMRAWQGKYAGERPLTLSVNLSSKDFMLPDLIDQIGQVLHQTGYAAHCLRLELTESVIMADAESTIHTLQQLKALGVRLQVDDFGTGFSSLNYLHRLPIDTLKIDRSFVSRMCSDPDTEKIVQIIISLADGLGKDVIAEGVETAGQLAKLRKLGCLYAQGYYFSKPVSGEAAERLIVVDSRWRARRV